MPSVTGASGVTVLRHTWGNNLDLEFIGIGQPGLPRGLAPPAAQGVILETRDRVPLWALWVEPASPSACVLASLSLSLS